MSCRPLPPKASEFFILAATHSLSSSNRRCQFQLTVVLDLVPWRSTQISSNAYESVAIFMWINFAGVKGSLEGPQVKHSDIESFWDSPVISPGLAAVTSSNWTCWVWALSDRQHYGQLTQHAMQFTETVWPSLVQNLEPSPPKYCSRKWSVDLTLKISSWPCFIDKIEIDKTEVYLRKPLYKDVVLNQN